MAVQSVFVCGVGLHSEATPPRFPSRASHTLGDQKEGSGILNHHPPHDVRVSLIISHCEEEEPVGEMRNRQMMRFRKGYVSSLHSVNNGEWW